MNQDPRARWRVVVATTAMLSFISFWRTAAIVLNDLGSSASYAGGIAEQAMGHAAPWFILGVMLFSYAVRAVYIESCTMFTRGGVYRVVKEAMGGSQKLLAIPTSYAYHNPKAMLSAPAIVCRPKLRRDIRRALSANGSPIRTDINSMPSVDPMPKTAR
jgi:hypothetical protein